MSPKIALVTGSAKRIGRHIAESLLQNGYFVLLHYHQSKAELLDWACRYPHQYELIQADFSIEDELRQVTTHPLFKEVSLLINSASYIQIDSCLTHESEDLKRLFQTNTFSPLRLMQALVKDRPNQNTHIINLIDSQCFKHKSPYFSYLMSKKSLYEMSQFAALEWAPHTRVNAICPGWILDLPDEVLANHTSHPNEQRHQNIPLKRQGSADDIVKTMHFLEQNSYLTGQCVFVGGGDHLG